MPATNARCKTILLALAAVLAVAAASSYAPAAVAPAEASGQEQAKRDSAEVPSARPPGAGAAPSHGPPSYELRGRDHLGNAAPLVPHRKGLAVIADFADARLEDWHGPGISSVAQLKVQLRRMEAHWAWLSRGLETFRWDVVRVTLPVDLRPDAYASWSAYRDAVASLVRQKVDVSAYDANHDGVIDSAWVIASSNGCTQCSFLIGGASRNGGVNIFVDGQDGQSLAQGATGNFNHETSHTLGVPDLYGPYGTIAYLSIMADSWAVPPNGFTAYERTLLGWVKPQVVARTRRGLGLSPADDGVRAIRVPTARRSEYFLIEYRRRPASGYGSTAPVPYDGLAVYHVLEGSGQGVDPPLLKLEPAGGAIAPGSAPAQTDFFYPGNPGMRLPTVLRSYFGNQEVFRLTSLRRAKNGGVTFDIKVAPTRPTPNLLANPSFESGSGGPPTSWASGAFQSSAVFGLASGTAKSGTRSASIAAATPNDAIWSQSVSGLTPGHGYALCGWLKGQNVATTPAAGVGANVSVVGGFVLSQSRSGTFDWAESCVMFKAEATSSQVACRLGFYGSTVTGKVWCDDMLLTPLRSAF